MFASISLSALILAASTVSGLVFPRGGDPPAGWTTDKLEAYPEFHDRYIALGCSNMHSTPFFEECCHPLQKDEKLDDRPADCVPSVYTPSSTTTPAQPTPVYASDESDSGCDEADGEEEDGSYEEPPANERIATSPATGFVNIVQNANWGVQSGGYATFYYQNGNAGACGQRHSDYDLIAAMDYRRYGNTNARSGLCGKRVQITNNKNHKTVTVTIADACPSCKNSNSIDLSVGAFKKIATLEEGMVPITWKFV